MVSGSAHRAATGFLSPWAGCSTRTSEKPHGKFLTMNLSVPTKVWGEDWTILSIANTRYYLLTVIDYFSRYIVAWGVVKTVTQREVQNLLALAYLSEGIEQQDPNPYSELIKVLRIWPGKPRGLSGIWRWCSPPAGPIGPQTTPGRKDGIAPSSKRRSTATPHTPQRRSPALLSQDTFGSITKSGRIRLCGITPPGSCIAWGTTQNFWSITEKWSELSKSRE